MALRRIKLDDYQIAACDLWTAPDGTVYVPVPFVVPITFRAAAGVAYPGVEIGCDSEFDFEASVISAVVIVPGATVQVQWPDGRYNSNPGIPVYDFIGTGKRALLLDPPELIPRGDKIRLNIQGGAVDSTINLFFEGVLKVPMVKS